jgi:hypothetical protein
VTKPHATGPLPRGDLACRLVDASPLTCSGLFRQRRIIGATRAAPGLRSEKAPLLAARSLASAAPADGNHRHKSVAKIERHVGRRDFDHPVLCGKLHLALRVSTHVIRQRPDHYIKSYREDFGAQIQQLGFDSLIARLEEGEKPADIRKTTDVKW